jgi:hypothetical protein
LIKVDYKKLAEMMGMTNVRSASNAMAALKKKMALITSPPATDADNVETEGVKKKGAGGARGRAKKSAADAVDTNTTAPTNGTSNEAIDDLERTPKKGRGRAKKNAVPALDIKKEQTDVDDEQDQDAITNKLATSTATRKTALKKKNNAVKKEPMDSGEESNEFIAGAQNTATGKTNAAKGQKVVHGRKRSADAVEVDEKDEAVTKKRSRSAKSAAPKDKSDKQLVPNEGSKATVQHDTNEKEVEEDGDGTKGKFLHFSFRFSDLFISYRRHTWIYQDG